MKKWEYKKIDGFEDLNHLGKEGWEVCGSYYYGGWSFVLKREIIEKKEDLYDDDEYNG